MLWGSNKFHINGKIQPEILLTLFTAYCDSWAQGWETFSDSVCFILKEFDEKESLREFNVCSAWPLKEGERARLVLGKLLPPPFLPLLQLQGSWKYTGGFRRPGSSPGSATYYLCDFGRKKAPTTKLLSSVEEVTASHGDPLGQPSSFTNLPGLGTSMKRVFVKKGAIDWNILAKTCW